MKYVEIFSALLTPTIAIFLAWIAFNEYQTNKKQFRLALYNKRYEIFEALMDLFTTVLKEAKIDMKSLNIFYIKINKGYFLFGKDIHDYINIVKEKAICLQYLNIMFSEMRLSAGQKSEKRDKYAKELEELLLWFADQDKTSREKFEKYLLFK